MPQQWAVAISFADPNDGQIVIGQHRGERKIRLHVHHIHADIRSFDQKFQGIVLRQISRAENSEHADSLRIRARETVDLPEIESERLQGET